MLKIKDLTYSYGTNEVLNNINISVSDGEFIAVIGPNGAGKSTLIKIIDGIIRPECDSIFLNDRSIVEIPRKELAGSIAYLPQESKFTFTYTVREVVLMGRFPYLEAGWAYLPEDLRVVKSVMEMMEISHFSQRNFNELSGGEKQRVLIASALAQEPRIILLDEPTTALDLRHQISIFEILKKLRKEQNITIIVVTHDINLAAQFCERIILMKSGQVIRDGVPENVLKFQVLQETFGVKVYIDINPLTNSLYILPYE